MSWLSREHTPPYGLPLGGHQLHPGGSRDSLTPWKPHWAVRILTVGRPRRQPGRKLTARSRTGGGAVGTPHLLRNAWKAGQTAWRCPRKSFLLPLQPPGPSHSRVHPRCPHQAYRFSRCPSSRKPSWTAEVWCRCHCSMAPRCVPCPPVTVVRMSISPLACRLLRAGHSSLSSASRRSHSAYTYFCGMRVGTLWRASSQMREHPAWGRRDPASDRT